jgi:hypothetical protein
VEAGCVNTALGARADLPGAADHITPVRLTSHVRAFLPEAVVRDAVTGTNWEGTGAVPDVACDPDGALQVAVEELRRG